jgi:hypothetical protein
MTNASHEEIRNLEPDLFPKGLSLKTKIGYALIDAGKYIEKNTVKIGIAAATVATTGNFSVYYNVNGIGEWYVKNIFLPHKDLMVTLFGPSNDPAWNYIGMPFLMTAVSIPVALYAFGSSIKKIGYKINPRFGLNF